MATSVTNVNKNSSISRRVLLIPPQRVLLAVCYCNYLVPSNHRQSCMCPGFTEELLKVLDELQRAIKSREVSSVRVFLSHLLLEDQRNWDRTTETRVSYLYNRPWVRTLRDLLWGLHQSHMARDAASSEACSL